MVKAYSISTTVERLERALETIDTFYNAACLNWSGKTIEGLDYSEVISESLLRLVIKGKLSRIAPIYREESYKTKTHDGETKTRTSRREEICAKELYNKDLPYIGKVIDYQVPLKANQTDRAGKIDLVAFRKKSKNVFIIELKFNGNKETLLRAALEIATYYRMLSRNNFLASYKEFAGLKFHDVRKALLLANGARSYEEARDLERLPNLKRLMQELEVEIYGLLFTEGRPDEERIFRMA